MTTRVVTNKVRFSFCAVGAMRRNELSGRDEFSTQIIIPKTDTETINAIKSAAKLAIQEHWGDKVPAKIRNPLKDGDKETRGDGSPLGEEYANSYYMTVKSMKRPGIIDAHGTELLGPDDVQSGDYGRVSINAYVYDQSANKGVGFGLNNVQLLEKGKGFKGEQKSAAEDFGVATKATQKVDADDDAW